MKKILVNFSYIFLLTFGITCLISTYAFVDFKSGLISMILGGLCVLAAFIEVIYLCKRGFFEE